MHPSPIPLHDSPDLPCAWEILGGGRYEAPRGKDFPAHAHQEWEWVYYRAGHILCRHGADEPFRARPGTLWLTPPQITHAEIARTAYRCDFIALRGPCALALPRCCQDDAAGSIGRICESILQECAAPRWPDRARMLALLSEALWRQVVRRLAAPEPPGPSPAASARRQAAEQIVRAAEAAWAERPTLSVARVARQAGASVSSLRAYFQQVHGCSPQAYRCRQQGRRAIEMLRRSPGLTLEAVAEHCGYYSASHLSRRVKRLTGLSPSRSRW